jgi:hypothetical protein
MMYWQFNIRNVQSVPNLYSWISVQLPPALHFRTIWFAWCNAGGSGTNKALVVLKPTGLTGSINTGQLPLQNKRMYEGILVGDIGNRDRWLNRHGCLRLTVTALELPWNFGALCCRSWPNLQNHILIPLHGFFSWPKIMKRWGKIPGALERTRGTFLSWNLSWENGPFRTDHPEEIATHVGNLMS